MTATDTINAVTIPTIRTAVSDPDICPYFTSALRLAPAITGTPIIKVNSAATVRETPSIRAPMIVAPERDVPGNIAAISWNTPITNAILYDMECIFLTFGCLPACIVSTIINAIPKTISAPATHGAL